MWVHVVLMVTVTKTISELPDSLDLMFTASGLVGVNRKRCRPN